MKRSEFKKKVKNNINLCCLCKKNKASGTYKGLSVCIMCKHKLILEK